MKTELTIQESNKLIELGVDKKLANVSADVPDYDKPEWNDPNAIDILESQCVFSLESLLAILPKKITYNNFTYAPNIWVDEMGAWNVEYVTLNMPFDDIGLSIRAEELIDAIYQELCYLRTNNIQEL